MSAINKNMHSLTRAWNMFTPNALSNHAWSDYTKKNKQQQALVVELLSDSKFAT